MELGGMWLMLNLSRALGLTPVCRHCDSALWTCVYYAHSIYRVVFIVILNIFSLFTFFVDVIYDTRNIEHFVVSTISRVHFFLWLLQLLMLIIITDFSAWTGRSRLIRIYEFLDFLKKSNLKAFGNRKRREMKRVAISLMGLVMVIWTNITDTAQFIAEISREDKEMIVLYLYGAVQLESIAAVLLVLKFTFMMYMYHGALESLNGELSRILLSFNKRKIRTLTSAEIDSLRSIGTAYTWVGKTVNQFNTTDGSVLLLILVLFYGSVIISLNKIIVAVIGFARNKVPLQEIPVLWVLSITFITVGLVEPSHQFYKEVDTMRVLVAKLIYQSAGPGEATPQALRICCNKLMLISPAFAPLGVFNLTRSLLVAVLSTSVTCLFYLVQCQMNKIQ